MSKPGWSNNGRGGGGVSILQLLLLWMPLIMMMTAAMRVRLSSATDINRKTGPLDAFLGSAQAGLLAFGLFVFSSKAQDVINATDLPDAYTARNISITVRTIILGLSWLATFIFAANSAGLLGLTFQWLLFPDSVKDEEEEAAARRAAQEAAGPQLPKIGVTSKPGEVRRAFAAAEQLGKKEGSSKAAAASAAAAAPPQQQQMEAAADISSSSSSAS